MTNKYESILTATKGSDIRNDVYRYLNELNFKNQTCMCLLAVQGVAIIILTMTVLMQR